MADYATNHTPRYRTRYSALGQVHTLTIRLERDTPDPAADGKAIADAFFNAVSRMLVDSFTILGADVAGQDSEIFLPTTLIPVITGPLSGAAGDNSYRPLFLSFQGRSPTGSRSSVYLYGTTASPTAASNEPNDYRLTTAEDPYVAAAVDALNGGVSSDGAAAIDGTAAVWYPYANVGFNGAYQRKARKG